MTGTHRIKNVDYLEYNFCWLKNCQENTFSEEKVGSYSCSDNHVKEIDVFDEGGQCDQEKDCVFQVPGNTQTEFYGNIGEKSDKTVYSSPYNYWKIKIISHSVKDRQHRGNQKEARAPRTEKKDGNYPPDNAFSAAGDIHFDKDELWKIGFGGAGIDVFTIAAHEIGHAIGLGH